MSIGETLRNQPGVASRSFGPADRPAGHSRSRWRPRPDPAGRATHGRSVHPVCRPCGDSEPGGGAADRSRAWPGNPALRFQRDRRSRECHHRSDPEDAASGHHRQRDLRCRVGGEGNGAAGDVRVGNGTLRWIAGGGGRRSGDVDTPEGEVVNSQSRSGFGSVGLSWTGAKGYFGGSYGYDDTSSAFRLSKEASCSRRHGSTAFALRGGAHDLTGAFDAFRATRQFAATNTKNWRATRSVPRSRTTRPSSN